MMHRQGSSKHQTTTMAALAIAAVLLLLQASPLTAMATPPSSIEDACRGAAERHPGISYAHCVSSLSADARARDAADLHALAALATRISIEHATTTLSKLDGMNEAEPSPRARARLAHCLDLYGAAADVLRDALDNIRAGVYGRALEQIAAAGGAAEKCEDVWKGEEKAKVPVARHDREYGRMAVVALGLTSGVA